MNILESIIACMRDDAPVREVRRGLYWTAVTSSFCGLASTMMRESCPAGQGEETIPDSFTEQSALQLARLALSTDIGKVSVGLAAINSLIEIDISRCTEINAADLLMREGRERNVSVIGHFPFTDELRTVTKNLWVIEKWQRPGDYPESDALEYLPRSDIVAISSTTLINGTLSGLLALCTERCVKMLLGPTTPMTEILFDYGIDIISGSKVINEMTALKYISEGANFRQLKRTGSINLLTMRRTRTG